MTDDQFIDEEHSRVSKIENQWVPQRFMPLIERIVIFHEGKETLVQLAGFQKGVTNFCPFFLDRICGSGIC